jgi:hypothetical protein
MDARHPVERLFAAKYFQQHFSAYCTRTDGIDPNTVSPVLALIADALQIVVFPLFVEGAASPADDILDLGIGAVLVRLLGWHWEFLPSFFAKLLPGVDLVPLWTIAVASLYGKSKRSPVTIEGSREERPTQRNPRCV